MIQECQHRILDKTHFLTQNQLRTPEVTILKGRESPCWLAVLHRLCLDFAAPFGIWDPESLLPNDRELAMHEVSTECSRAVFALHTLHKHLTRTHSRHTTHIPARHTGARLRPAPPLLCATAALGRLASLGRGDCLGSRCTRVQLRAQLCRRTRYATHTRARTHT